MSFEILTSIGSSTLGATAAYFLQRLYSYFQEKRKEKEKLKIAEEKNFQKIRASDSIYLLGNYLDEKLGVFCGGICKIFFYSDLHHIVAIF